MTTLIRTIKSTTESLLGPGTGWVLVLILAVLITTFLGGKLI